MIDEFLKNFELKLDEINQKVDNLNNAQDYQIDILTATDVMKILTINRNTVNELFRREDFPKIKGIKSNKIERTAFVNWLRSIT